MLIGVSMIISVLKSKFIITRVNPAIIIIGQYGTPLFLLILVRKAGMNLSSDITKASLEPAAIYALKIAQFEVIAITRNITPQIGPRY